MNLFWILLLVATFGQNGDTSTAPRGTKTPYTPSDSTAVAALAGYTPTFINYIGRHGARHVTSLKELSVLDHFLKGAEAAGNLTTQGDSLRVRVSRILAIEKQYIPGDLTALGREEQYNIGRRMRTHYPQLLSLPNSCLRIAYTEEARTRQSEESFMSAFAPGSNPCLSLDPSDSVRLRFFELAPRYKAFAKNGPWSASFAQLLQERDYQAQLTGMVRRWFVPDIARKLLTGTMSDTLKSGKPGIDGAQALAEAVYGAASITGGLSAEIAMAGYTPESVDIFALLSPQEAQWLALIGGVKDFLVKGPGTDPNGIQVRDAAPLLVDLLQTTDDAIRKNQGGANLRFAHAETIAPLAALLELEGAATPDTALTHYPEVWKADRIIPFSANIQWIVYRGTRDSDPALIKILYNEKPVHLPIATPSFPYYRWEDVRDFYTSKLARLGVQRGEDMYQYLLKLQ